MKHTAKKLLLSTLLCTTLLSNTACSAIKNNSAEKVEQASDLLDNWVGNNNEVLLQARSLLEIALFLDNKSVPARIEMARYYIMRGDLKSAEKSLTEAKKLQPNNANVYVLFGHLYFLQKDNEKALQALEKAEKIGTDNPWLYMNKADVLNEQGKREEALSLQEKAINNSLATVKLKRNASLELATYYQIEKNNIAKAEKYYNLHVNTNPNYAKAYANRAVFYACEKHDFTKANNDINKALSLTKNADIKRRKGVIHWLEWQSQYTTADPKAEETYKIAKQYLFDNIIVFVANSCFSNQSWRNFGNSAGQALDKGIDFNPNDIARFYQSTQQYQKVKALSQKYDIADKYKTKTMKVEDYLAEQCDIYGYC